MSVGIEVAGRHKESRNFTRSCKFSCVSAADSREDATAFSVVLAEVGRSCPFVTAASLPGPVHGLFRFALLLLLLDACIVEGEQQHATRKCLCRNCLSGPCQYYELDIYHPGRVKTTRLGFTHNPTARHFISAGRVLDISTELLRSNFCRITILRFARPWPHTTATTAITTIQWAASTTSSITRVIILARRNNPRHSSARLLKHHNHNLLLRPATSRRTHLVIQISSHTTTTINQQRVVLLKL